MRWRVPRCYPLVALAVVLAVPLRHAMAQPAAPAKPTPAARAVKADALARDLVVELRERVLGQNGQDDADATGGYTVSTQATDGGVGPQQARVLSGEKAVLRVAHSTPMQWVQNAQQGSTTLIAGAASASGSHASITQATTLVEAGQTLVVTPHWAGASRPVRVELTWQTDSVDERTGAELPTTTRRQFSTTVRVPLQQWVTIATRGSHLATGSYSSAGAMEPLRALQLRVSVP